MGRGGGGVRNNDPIISCLAFCSLKNLKHSSYLTGDTVLELPAKPTLPRTSALQPRPSTDGDAQGEAMRCAVGDDIEVYWQGDKQWRRGSIVRASCGDLVHTSACIRGQVGAKRGVVDSPGVGRRRN